MRFGTPFKRAAVLCLALIAVGCIPFEPSELDVTEGGSMGILAAFLTPQTTTATPTVVLPLQRFVIVGNQGLGLYSDDASTWTQMDIASDTNVTLHKVIWTGSAYVAVGEDGGSGNEVIYRSSNGVDWTAATISANCSGTSTLVDLVLGGGRLMAIGAAGGGAACAQTSTDDGATWTQVNTGTAILPFLKVGYDGTVFIAMTSSAGAGMLDFATTGTATFALGGGNASPGGASAPVVGDVTGYGTDLVWVGARANGNADCFYSNDNGGSWNGSFGPVFNNNAVNYPRAVAINTAQTLTVSAGDNCFFDETNSVSNFNWTGAGGQISGCSAVDFKDMIFESGSATFFAVGQKSGTALWSTSNGTAWTEVGNIAGVTPNSLASSQ